MVAKDKTKKEREEGKINLTNIGWVLNPDGSQGYTLNPLTGCFNGCLYCYARKLANGRLRNRYLHNPNVAPDYPQGTWCKWDTKGELLDIRYLDPFYPRFWPGRMEELAKRNTLIHKKGFSIKPIGIFIVDMGDLFGIGIPEKWTSEVLDLISDNGYDRFYLLTHQPQNLDKFSPFSDNCWVGVTATNTNKTMIAMEYLIAVKAKIKFISFEPLLERIRPRFGGINLYWDTLDWIIIGAMTGRRNELIELNKQYPDLTLLRYGRIWTLQPKLEWVLEIVRAADKAHIPVFLKLNLVPGITDSLNPEKIKLQDEGVWLRQEMPK